MPRVTRNENGGAVGPPTPAGMRTRVRATDTIYVDERAFNVPASNFTWTWGHNVRDAFITDDTDYSMDAPTPVEQPVDDTVFRSEDGRVLVMEAEDDGESRVHLRVRSRTTVSSTDLSAHEALKLARAIFEHIDKKYGGNDVE